MISRNGHFDCASLFFPFRPVDVQNVLFGSIWTDIRNDGRIDSSNFEFLSICSSDDKFSIKIASRISLRWTFDHIGSDRDIRRHISFHSQNDWCCAFDLKCHALGQLHALLWSRLERDFHLGEATGWNWILRCIRRRATATWNCSCNRDRLVSHISDNQFPCLGNICLHFSKIENWRIKDDRRRAGWNICLRTILLHKTRIPCLIHRLGS